MKRKNLKDREGKVFQVNKVGRMSREKVSSPAIEEGNPGELLLLPWII